MPDVLHTVRAGHRIMVHVQSSCAQPALHTQRRDGCATHRAPLRALVPRSVKAALTVMLALRLGENSWFPVRNCPSLHPSPHELTHVNTVASVTFSST